MLSSSALFDVYWIKHHCTVQQQQRIEHNVKYAPVWFPLFQRKQSDKSYCREQDIGDCIKHSVAPVREIEYQE